MIVEVDPRVDDRWRALVERTAGSLFHSPEWMHVLADTYGWDPRAHVVLGQSGTPKSGLPWCRVSDPGGERIVSLPFSDFCGPIGDPPFDRLYDALGQMELPVRCRILADAGSGASQPVAGTARWHSIGLCGDPADRWSALTPSARRAVKKARNDGVTVVERTDVAFVPQFLRLHTGIRKAKYRLLPQPVAFFLALRDRFDATGAWHPLVAVRGGKVLAATVYLHSGDVLYYKFNASDPVALGSRPNDMLLWAGIELAMHLGCHSLDLGASDDDQPGLIRFKRGFGSTEREIQTLAFGPAPPASHAQFRVVLDGLTTRFTDPSVTDAAAEVAGALLYRYFA